MSQLLEQLIEQVTPAAQHARVADVVVGSHWTLVLLEDSAQCARGGLATSLEELSDHHHTGQPSVRDAGRLLDYRAVDLLRLSLSDSMPEVSIGFATINALLDVDLSLCQEVNALDSILEHGTGRDIAVVGHFPFVPRLRSAARTLWVLELLPQGADLPASSAPEILPRADVVAITGTSLANGTFDDLLGHCRKDAFVVVLGATTPLSPLLLDAGVNAIAGTLVEDPEVVRLGVSQGANFRQIQGKRLVVMMRKG